MAAKRWTVAGRLFQAVMWRELAMTFDGRTTSWGMPPGWVTTFMPRWDRERGLLFWEAAGQTGGEG